MTFQFKCDSANGFSEVSGSISFDEENLKFEFQSNYLGLVKGEVSDINIPFNQVEDIEFEKKFFSRKIIISVNSLKNLDKFPLIQEYIIKIPVKKKHIDKAKEFVTKSNFDLGQYKLNKLE